MTYRRPAVTVIQEFLAAAPALGVIQLPTCVVGPAYQLVNNALFGNYIGNQADYAYANLIAGALPDIEALDPDEVYPATKKPVALYLKNAIVEAATESLVGAGISTTFTDATTSRFANVVAGDKIRIVENLGIIVLAAQTNGATVSTPGMRNRLTAGTAGQFADVKVGDTVSVTAGTNTTIGDYVVDVKISDDVIRVVGDINDGGGVSTDVAYSITGDRGVANAGDYRIKSKTDANTVVLESPLIENESLIKYTVIRSVAKIDLVRDTDFDVTADAVTIHTGLLYGTLPIVSGTVYGTYRALRNDLAARVKDFSGSSEVISYFGGADQIDPANPLGYCLNIKSQNTTTKINGLGLDENAVSNELLSYGKAMDVLKLTDMYAITVLTSNTVIHQALRSHVNGLSLKDKERIGLVSRLIITEELQVEATTVETALVGARVIVNTQVDGTTAFATNPKEVLDATTDQFLNVNKGDKLVVVGGTNAIVGTYTVTSITNVNKLVVDADMCTGDVSNLEYYIVRQDGVSADGASLYDRNANFIDDGVAAGYFVRFISGPVEGTYAISGVPSNKTITFAQIPGITSLQAGVEYEIYRELSKTEQAEIMAGYSQSLAARRIINTWPDILKAPVGAVTVNLPGYYGSATIGSLVSGLPPQQGFTNYSVTGFLGLEHSTGYFDDDQLDIIASGGTLVFIQEGEDQPLVIRHQLTTDVSTIKFQELSVTKNVDYISKYIRSVYKPMPGRYNIVDSAFDDIKTTAKSVITFLKDTTKLPRIGGVIRGGSLTSLAADDTQIDTIAGTFTLSIPIPLNNLIFTIQV